jgi:hypothetical protein
MLQGNVLAVQGGDAQAGDVQAEAVARMPVSTLLGVIDQSDLQLCPTVMDLPDQINVAIEWIYVGANPAFKEHVGKMVRRDVWVNIKLGLAAAGQQGE